MCQRLGAEERIILWLASYPDGRRHAGTGQQRRHVQLSPMPWFRQTLCDVGGCQGADVQFLSVLCGGHGGRQDVLDAWTYYSNSAPSKAQGKVVPVSSLLLVRPAVSHEGALTIWTQEEDLQREYYDRPLDCYSVDILDVFVLDELWPLNFKCQHREDLANIAKISLSSPLFVADWGETLDIAAVPGFRLGDGSSTTASATLLHWGLDHENAKNFLEQTPVLAKPCPITILVEAKRFSRLLLLTRWHSVLRLAWSFGRAIARLGDVHHGPFLDFPARDSQCWTHRGQHENEPNPNQDGAEPVQLSADECRELAQTLKQAHSQTNSCTTAEAEKKVRVLEAWERSLRLALGLT